MELDTAVDELGGLTLVSLADESTSESDREFSRLMMDALPVPLPIRAVELLKRLDSLVEELKRDVLPDFDRIILAGQELVLLDAFAARDIDVPVVVALPPWVNSEVQQRVQSNLPPGLDVSVIKTPEHPDVTTRPGATLMALCGFDAGSSMWLVPASSRAVMDSYRWHFLYETVLLDPIGLPIHLRGLLFNVITDRPLDRVLAPAPSTSLVEV